MVYKMVFNVDGGCRRNGQVDSFGAAAAVCYSPNPNRHWYTTRRLPEEDYPPFPTSQRAEITAVILALEWALEKYDELDGYPRLKVTVRTDSKYIIGCMTNWIYKWSQNGWMNAAGNPVANQDLIREASDLDDRVMELGNVEYEWVPRSENEDADGYCNDVMNDMEDE
ncbi:putative ribonuclease H1 [Halenospora varia]|nr:putative ribonuclease H1 [Halenospora varia]